MELPDTPKDIRCLISFYAQRNDWWIIIDPPDAFFNLLGWMPEKLKKYLSHGDIGLFISPTEMQIFLIPKKLLPYTLIYEKFPSRQKHMKSPNKNFICFKPESLVSLKAWLNLDPGATIQ